MDKPELYEKARGDVKPPTKDYYDTNFGKLYFDGKSFIVPGHKRKTTIQVEWWLKIHVQ